MISALRILILAVVSFSALPALRAHAPGECSLIIARDEEALELRLVVSLPSAAALLGPELVPALAADTFDRHRPALLAAAGEGCLLRDADGAAIKPDRVLATFRNEHEVHLDFFFPPASRPARLNMPLLAKIGREVWCEVSDRRVSPPVRALLQPRSAELTLAP